MEHLEGLLKLTENELAAIVQNGKFRSREEIDSVYKLIDIAKDVYCIWKYEDEEDGESYDDGMEMRGGRSYNDGRSYARGRRYAKRDDMGRYSREYRDGRSMRGYSRDSKEDYIEDLHEMMEKAPTEEARQTIKRMIEQMK